MLYDVLGGSRHLSRPLMMEWFLVFNTIIHQPSHYIMRRTSRVSTSLIRVDQGDKETVSPIGVGGHKVSTLDLKIFPIDCTSKR